MTLHITIGVVVFIAFVGGYCLGLWTDHNGRDNAYKAGFRDGSDAWWPKADDNASALDSLLADETGA